MAGYPAYQGNKYYFSRNPRIYVSNFQIEWYHFEWSAGRNHNLDWIIGKSNPNDVYMDIGIQIWINRLHMSFYLKQREWSYSCQSSRLRRSKGLLFAEPCEGLNIPEGCLIVINMFLYNFDDAPIYWRSTVTDFLIHELKFECNLVELYWFSKFSDNGLYPIAQILVKINNFIIFILSKYQS